MRLALGAPAQSVAALVVGRALLLGAIGVALGVAGAYVGGRAIASMLFGVPAFEPVTVTALKALAVPRIPSVHPDVDSVDFRA